jgi:hypothetical protein
MPQYPSNIIKKNLHTYGKDFFLNGKPYIGYYYQLEDKFYAGEEPTLNDPELIDIKKALLQLAKNKAKQYAPSLYFVKKTNENNIKKVSADEFYNYTDNPLYVTVKIDVTNPSSIENAKLLLPGIDQYLNQN